MIRRLAPPLAVLLLAGISFKVLAVDKRAAEKTISSPEWGEWRGPHRDNISPDKGLLDKWPTEGPALVWKFAGLGKGFSTVSISGGRIFTMGDRADAQCVIALNLTDGKELWATPVGQPANPGGYPGPRCTPTVEDDLVYALGTDGTLVCLKAATGSEVWRKSLPQDFGGKMHSGWGYSESPLIDGDKLVCTPGGPDAGIVALNKKTGAEIWRSVIPALGENGTDGAGYASIVIGNGGGVRQYVQLMGRGAVGVAAEDGRFLWGYNRVANKTANIPTPLVKDDYVFCSSGYGTGSALLKLSAAGSGVQADEVYFLEGKELQNHHGGMVMIGDYIYSGHGHGAGAPTCLEWKTGKIVWRQNHGPGTGSAAVGCADGNLYFRYENGVMALIGATPEKYVEKGSFQIPDCTHPSWPQPVIIGGKLYLREQDELFCYDVKK